MDRRSFVVVISVACLAGAALAGKGGVRLGKPKLVRGDKYVVDFSLAKVVDAPDAIGDGGIARTGALSFDGCGDAPEGAEKGWKGRTVKARDLIAITVVDVVDGGKSGRDWPGAHCAFRVADAGDPDKWAELPLDVVPAFNSPTGVVRDGDRVFVDLNFNGYAKETRGKGNFVVALDLAAHKQLWRSADMTSNSAMLLVDGAIVTGYGFSMEKHFLVVLDAATGKQVQKIDLPKSPGEIMRKGDDIYVRLYDGYAVIPIAR